MASSLEQQLSKSRKFAAVPSVNRGGASSRSKPSLLYHRKKAADYDSRTIYHLGLNGLEELVQDTIQDEMKAIKLEEFREALFSQAAAETERSLQDKETNAQLDEAIDAFLIHLAPFFLTRPAQKVLEYLIRQFEIQVHNVDTLLRCSIPYHDTEFFLKLVSVPCAIKQTKWAFLDTMVKNKNPLSRTQLVKSCLSETHVLRSIIQIVNEQPANDKVVSFFAVVACQLIDRGSQSKRNAQTKQKQGILDGTIVPMLTPATLDAMRDKSHPERQRAGYLIVSQLAKHAALTDKAAKLFMLSAIRKATKETLGQALQCVSMILFFSPETTSIPFNCVKRLGDKYSDQGLAETLSQTFGTNATSGPASRLLKDLYFQMSRQSKFWPKLSACVSRSLPMEIGTLFSSLAEQDQQQQNEQGADKTKLIEIAQTIASSRPDQLDETLNDSENQATLNFATKCFSSNSKFFQSAPIETEGVHTTLRLALHHHNASVRAHALAELCKTENLGIAGLGIEILADRIRDQNVQVVDAALDLGSQILVTDHVVQVEARLLVDAFEFCCRKWYSNENILQKVIQMIAKLKIVEDQERKEEPDSDNDEDEDMGQTQNEIEAIYLDALLILVQFYHASKLKSDAIKGTKALLKGGIHAPKVFKENNSSQIQLASGVTAAVIEKMCLRGIEKSLPDACLALAGILANSKRVDLAIMTARLSTSQLTWGENSNILFTDNKTRESVLGDAAKTLVSDTMSPETHATSQYDVNNNTSTLSIKVLCTLLGAPEKAYSKSIGKETVPKLVSSFFPGCLLRVLLAVASGTIYKVSAIGQRRALVVICAMVQAYTDQHKSKINYSFLESTPYLIPALCSKNSGIRQAALRCVDAVLQSSSSAKPSPYLRYCGNDSNDDGSEAQESIPLPDDFSSVGDSKDLLPILERVSGSRKELETDSATCERIFRTFTSSEQQVCIKGILDRVSVFMLLNDSSQQSEEWHAASRCAEGILKPIILNVPVATLGKASCQVAQIAVNKAMNKVLSLILKRWNESEAEIDIQVLHDALQKSKDIRSTAVQALASPHVYNLLNSSEKGAVFDSLCTLVLKNRDQDPQTSAECLNAMALIPFSGELLNERFSRKAVSDNEVNVLLEACRARLFANNQPKVSLELCVHLTKPLYDLLGKKSQNLAVLVCLNRVLQILSHQFQLQSKNPPKALVNALAHVDLNVAVNCTLGAFGAPVRNACLELLTNCAILFPQKALDIVRPVLKSVSAGENGENRYLYIILEHLMKCLASSNKKDAASIVDVIFQFVETCSSVSSNPARVLDLYEMLVHSTSPNTNETLWVVSMLLLEKGQAEEVSLEQQMWFVQQLLLRFSIKDQINTMVNLMDNLIQHDDSNADDDENLVDTIFSKSVAEIVSQNPENRFQLAESIAQVIADQLTTREFIKALRMMTQDQVERDDLQGEAGFLGLLNNLHRQIYICGFEADEDENPDRNQWEKIRQSLCIVLDKISALLSVPMFVAVLHELLKDQDAHVRHLAIRQLSTKVEQQNGKWRDGEVLMFLEMVSHLRDILVNKKESSINKQTALLSIDVLARHLGSMNPKPFIESMKSVVDVLCSSMKVFDPSSTKKKGEEIAVEEIQLASSACLCVGTLITILKQKSIVFLPKFTKSLLTGFKQYIEFYQATSAGGEKQVGAMEEEEEEQSPKRNENDDDKDEDDDDDDDDEVLESRAMLAQSAASSLHSLVLELAPFLSPYLNDLLWIAGQGNEEKYPQMIQLTSGRIASCIGESVAPRLLISPLKHCFISFLQSKNIQAAGRLFKILSISIKKMSQEVLSKQLVSIGEFFVETLQLRAHVIGSTCSVQVLEALETKVSTLEQIVADAFLDLVLILNGNQLKRTFKMLQQSLFDLKQLESAELEQGEQLLGTKRKRTTLSVSLLSRPFLRQCEAQTFYLILSCFSEKLMGLSVPLVHQMVGELLYDLELEFEDSQVAHAIAQQDGNKSKKRGDKKNKADTTNESEAAQELRWRHQQRLVRERAMNVIANYSEHKNRDSASGSDNMKQYVGVVDAVLKNMDIDHCRLENSDQHDQEEGLPEYFETLVDDTLSPCLVKIAQSVEDEAMWQTLHQGLLEFSKHSSPHVRKGMLSCLVALFEQVGESYIVLLTDTLPTVAELLEDKEQPVRQQAHKTARKLQQLSGEDLTTFLQ